LVCSLVAALPAWLRTISVAPAAASAATLVGSVSLVVVPVGAWLRVARAEPALADRALLAGAALSALPLALFGAVLKSTTHHRPLGGATFAVAALCLVTLCVGLSFRILREATERARKSTWQNLFYLGCGSSLVAAMVLGAAPTARPSLTDFAALALGAITTARVPVPRWVANVKLSWMIFGWVVLLACAALGLRNPNLVETLASRAPVSFGALSWLGGGS
jgi:hypothetical protein